MPTLRLLFVFSIFIFSLLPHKIDACGYSFIGECSTGVSLRINNSLDSFNVSECSFGKFFGGLNLGNIQSLSLARATAITWESCINNVTSVSLHYRVYEQGQSGGSWSMLNLQEDYNTLVGPYTARYRSQYTNNSLTNGLTAGKTYVMEIYFSAQIDTIGDDFIPETVLYQNNNGQNYKLTFQYGAAAAPPFSVVATRLIDEKCPGDSTGSVGVTVYGNQSNLFYQWSNVNNNFNTLYELTSGTYTVTVSGVNGFTQSQTMSISHPVPISITFADIQSVICGNTPGSASAVVQGGVLPYTYLWETGEPDSIASIPLPGSWGLSVTDSNGCIATAAVQVGGNSTLQRTLQKAICQGSSYSLGGQSFSSSGNYDVLVSGNGSCDTLFFLTITTLNPAAAINTLPALANLTCNNPTISLCAATVPGALFQWKRDNITVSNEACAIINSSGVYSVIATMQQLGQTCVSEHTIQVNSHLTAPVVQVTAVATYESCSNNGANIVFTAINNGETLLYLWTLNGNIISIANTCEITVLDLSNFTPPNLLVTDMYGCQGTSSGINLIINTPPNAPVAVATPINASGANNADGSVQVEITGGQPPYTSLWSNGSTGNILTGLLPGQYCITVSDATSCTVVNCVEVGFTTATQEWTNSKLKWYPNPVASGESLHLDLPEITGNQEIRMELYNLQGQMVWLKKISPDDVSINIFLPQELAAGQYLMRLQADGETFTHLLTIL